MMSSRTRKATTASRVVCFLECMTLRGGDWISEDYRDGRCVDAEPVGAYRLRVEGWIGVDRSEEQVEIEGLIADLERYLRPEKYKAATKFKYQIAQVNEKTMRRP